MKGIFAFFFALLISTICHGQTNIPSGVSLPANAVAKPLPGNIALPSPLFTRVYSPVIPINDIEKITFNTAIDSVSVTTQYRDGLGRSLQTVVKQGSPNNNDYIIPNTYDEFGRVVTSYLPYTASTNNGAFHNNPFQEDSTYYKTAFPYEKINYGEIVYDNSPLQQVLKQTAPGNSWTGSGVGISFSRRANTLSDSVHFWKINIINEDDVPVTNSFYAAGSLLVEETTDERGIRSSIFKDQTGKTILTKSALTLTPSPGHNGWLCTYYVYDEMNNLRTVIPPKAVDALNTSGINWNFSLSPDIKTGLCYSYFYDFRGRVIMKYIPGKGKNYFAYDLFDRMVMTQDPNLKTKSQWAFIKYDEQSRPFRSGFIKNTLNKDSIIARASRSKDYPALSGQYTITSETYFDDYAWVPAGTPSVNLNSANINSSNFITNYNASPEYAQPIVMSKRIRGAVTGVKKIILNTTTYLYDAMIYDDNGRPIQVQQMNITRGIDVSTVQYSFSGSTLRSHLRHVKSGGNAQQHTLLTKYNYYTSGRLEKIVKNIDSLGDKEIVSASYNESGQLKSKVVGQGLDSMSYDYNIRGWLTDINKAYVSNPSNSGNYFGESISYDYGFTHNQVNGAIAGVKWKAAGDRIARAYGFDYDMAGRLTQADFTQQNAGTTTWTNSTTDFSVGNLTYDAGGNTLSMTQKGLLIGSSSTIDSLIYQYFSNSNQLRKVSDAVGFNPPGLGDFTDTTLAGDDYTYDNNGNINKDNNRKMYTGTGNPGAVYNLLDKPDSIVIAGKAILNYYYDASGKTLRKKVRDYSTGTEVIKDYYYIAGFVYLNDTLQYVPHEEGRIRWAKKRNSYTGAVYNAFEYDYYLRDHLNNVRTVLTEGKDTTIYAASMETADSALVQQLFSNVYDPKYTVWPKPSAFDSVNSNKKVSLLNASTAINKIAGPAIILKVMAGDKVQINTFAWYNNVATSPVSNSALVTELLSTLVSGITAQSGGKILGADATVLSSSLNPQVLNFLNTRSYTSSRPKAYLNWVLLDNDFKYVAGNMDAIQVAAGSSKQALVAPLQTMAKNGYLYVYVSNQNKSDVYFDDLTITHTTGPLLQEQSYYPFGLQMAAISDKAANKLDSKNKFNGGVELEEDYGVNLYNTFYRQYDPQIGRFSGVDMLSEATMGMNPYHFGGNNPVSFNDPLGDLSSGDWKDFLNKYIKGGGTVSGFGPYGGHYGDGNPGYNPYNSDADNFAAGSSHFDNYNLWGTNGWAGSLDEAKNAYYKNGGTDGGVRGVQPTITITGVYHNGNFQTLKTDWNWHGNRLGKEGWSLADNSSSSNHWYNWDGSVFRAMVPDFLNFGVGFSGIFGLGAGSSIEFNWVTHGPQASWKPMITLTESVGGGFAMDATFNVGSLRYSGSASDIKRSMLSTNSFGNGDNPTIWVSASVSAVLNLGATGSFTYFPSGNFLYGGQVNFGAGLPFGPAPFNAAGGVSNTWIAHDFYN